MIVSREQLRSDSHTTGFKEETLEKVYQLLHLLRICGKHPFLKDRLVLKGGTALNLFVFNAPRLSVDIDLNYIGALDRNTMLEERPEMEKALSAVFAREGMTVTRQPHEHAGGKWRLKYTSSVT